MAQPSEEADGGYSYLAGCYHFEATPPQLELLGRAVLVAGHAGAPFLTAIDTTAFSNRKEPPHRLVRETLAALKASPQASFLGLFGPRFLLRHPYGKKSDPISSFDFEEFTRASGLRGMLWGHPALLALCVLCRPDAPPTVDGLPFHHYVNDEGDSTSLPCTERLVGTTSATLLRDHGINALMAYKGQPLIRLSGLRAINGEGLAVPQGIPRHPLVVHRGAIHARASVATEWVPPARAAGTMALAMQGTPAKPDSFSERTLGEASAPPARPDETAADSPEMATAEEDEILASGEDVSSAASPQPASVEDELAALLASLEAPAAPQNDSGDPPMDPELEALLKSLA